jgi:hypothetical protein
MSANNEDNIQLDIIKIRNLTLWGNEVSRYEEDKDKMIGILIDRLSQIRTIASKHAGVI